MPDFLVCPTYEQSLTKGNQTSSPWYRYFQGVFQGKPAGAEVSIIAGASPYLYTASQKGFLLVRGGTVSAIQFTRTVTTLTGFTSGLIPMSLGDSLTITYSALPTLVWYPT